MTRLPHISNQEEADIWAADLAHREPGIADIRVVLTEGENHVSGTPSDKLRVIFRAKKNHDLRELRSKILEQLKPYFNSKDTDWIVQTEPCLTKEDFDLYRMDHPLDRKQRAESKKKPKRKKRKILSKKERKEKEFLQRLKLKVRELSYE